MRTDGQTIRGNEMEIPHVNLESVKAWVKATFSNERIAEVSLVVATLLVTGYLGAVVYRAIQTYTIAGF